MFACSRLNPRHRAAASVAPFRDTPGIRAAVWASPSASPSAGRTLSRPRRCGRVSAITIAAAPAIRPAAVARAAQPALDDALEREPGERGGSERQRDNGRARESKDRSSTRSARRWPTSSAPAAPAWSATSKLFAAPGQPWSQSQPASQERESGGRSWNRQQLGWPLDQAEGRGSQAGERHLWADFGGRLGRGLRVFARSATSTDEEVDHKGGDRGDDDVVAVVQIGPAIAPSGCRPHAR